MGTLGTCTKCGKKKWINTTKLKAIHEKFGIRPSEWVKKKYVCSECADRQALIRESDVESAIDRLKEFGALCKKTYSGILQTKSSTDDINEKVKSSMTSLIESAGISRNRLKFISYKNIIIGVSIDMPIIGGFSIMFL